MNKVDIVCFGDSDWWYHNRGHMDIQLMRCYTGTRRILYINSIVIRKLNIGEGKMFIRRIRRKMQSIMRGMQPSGMENMVVYSPFTLPVHHIRFAREFNNLALRMQIYCCLRRLKMKKPIMWVACPAAAETAVRLPRTKLVYQRSDCYEEFPGIDTEQIKKYDRLLKEHADVVVYVNKALMSKEQSQCRKAVYLDHGVDYDFFAKAHLDNSIPDDMQNIPHPILGFYGGIDDHTSNISLIEEVADLLPDFSVVLVGSSSVNLANLALRKNVYLLGQKPYEQISHYGKCFDVCFMPWQQNDWIAACNPVKLKEYLALGKPIVSTPFSELHNYEGLVEVADDAESFAQAVRRAFYKDCPDQASIRRDKVIDCTWDAKAKLVLHVLFQTCE